MPEPLTDPNDMRRYSNALRLQSEQRIGELTQRLVSGEIDLATWESDMKAELRRANLEQFVTGRGGDATGVRRQDYLKLGSELKRQYKYLRRFAVTLEKSAEAGNPLDYAVSRARLYARSSQAMFWKSAIPVNLSQVPRDGKTRCRTNCKCRLRFQYERGTDGEIVAVLVWWLLSPAEHCPDCKKLGRTWNPLRVEVDQSVQESSIEQAVAVMLVEAPQLQMVESEIYAMWGMETVA